MLRLPTVTASLAYTALRCRTDLVTGELRPLLSDRWNDQIPQDIYLPICGVSTQQSVVVRQH